MRTCPICLKRHDIGPATEGVAFCPDCTPALEPAKPKCKKCHKPAPPDYGEWRVDSDDVNDLAHLICPECHYKLLAAEKEAALFAKLLARMPVAEDAPDAE